MTLMSRQSGIRQQCRCPVSMLLRQIHCRIQATRQQDIFEHTQVVNQLEVLKDQTDILKAKCSSGRFRQCFQRPIPDTDASGVGPQNSGQQMQQCGFAASTASSDCCCRSTGNLQLRYVQSEPVAWPGKTKILHGNHGLPRQIRCFGAAVV
jgi:hypothetical protein